MPKPYLFMNTRLRLSSKAETLEAIATATDQAKVTIATVNAEFLVTAQHNAAFRKALENMSHCTVDGSGPYIMLRFWTLLKREPGFERYAGADLVADLFEQYKDGSKSFFLLGGPPGLAQQAADTIRKQYPTIQIVGAEDGGVIETENLQIDEYLITRIQQATPDILLVGFGAPKQELWIQKASATLNIPVMIGVGGTFGFYVDKKRASGVTRALHLEWLSRMLREPGHWKRVIRAVIVFPLQALWWMIQPSKF